MKVAHLLFLIALLLSLYKWHDNLLTFLIDPNENPVDQESSINLPEENDQQDINKDKFISRNGLGVIEGRLISPASDVVPKQLLEMEANAKEGSFAYYGSADIDDIPPIDPNELEYTGLTTQLPATKPELEVVPADLMILESQPRSDSAQLDSDDSVPVVSENLLYPDELPPEPAEMEVEPKALLIRENRFGR